MKKIIPIILFQLGILFLYTCPATASTRPMLTGIQFESPSGSEDRIIFTLNSGTLPKIFKITGKRPRVVMDFPDTGQALWLKNMTKTNGHFVQRIRIGMHKGKNPKTRVVLDLAPHQPIHFDQHFNRKNNILIINVYAAGNKPKAANTAGTRAAASMAAQHPAGMASPGHEVAGQQPKKEEAFISPSSSLPEKRAPSFITRKPITTAAAEQAVPEYVFPEVPARPAGKTAGVTPPPATTPVREKQTAIKPLPSTGQLQKPAPTGSTAPVIRSIKFDNRSSRGEMIRFRLNGFYPPVVMGLKTNAPRVGCDFKNATVPESVKKLIECNGKYVKTIQVESSHNPNKVKVILNLVPGNEYDLQQIFFKKDNLFVIIINTVNKKITLIGP